MQTDLKQLAAYGRLRPVVVLGATSFIGMIVAFGGLAGHFWIGGPVPSLVAGMSLLVVSVAIWCCKYYLNRFAEWLQEVDQHTSKGQKTEADASIRAEF